MHICILLLGCSCPSIRDLSLHVTPNIPAEKWKDLGLELLHDNAELTHIEADIQQTSKKVNKMFEKWLTRKNATWNVLIAALEKIRLPYLANKIRKDPLSIGGKGMYVCFNATVTTLFILSLIN